ncbi:MAG: hypothetical protein AB8G16_05095 [Gammaproteobacteria bacterium]
MNTSPALHAKRLAFVLGGCSVLLEMAFLIAVSHARAPEGQFLAGQDHTVAAHVVPAPPVVLLPRFELSL